MHYKTVPFTHPTRQTPNFPRKGLAGTGKRINTPSCLKIDWLWLDVSSERIAGRWPGFSEEMDPWAGTSSPDISAASSHPPNAPSSRVCGRGCNESRRPWSAPRRRRCGTVAATFPPASPGPLPTSPHPTREKREGTHNKPNQGGPSEL